MMEASGMCRCRRRASCEGGREGGREGWGRGQIFICVEVYGRQGCQNDGLEEANR